MKLFRKKILKLGNKGMSLVELICGITMLSIIGTSISGVLMVSADSYNRGVSEASVQQEAQMVANQVNDLLIDATSKVRFSGSTLTIVQGDTKYEITHEQETLSLWYQEHEIDASENIISSSDRQLMAEGVKTFYVDDGNYERNGHASMEIQFVNSSREYPSTFAVTARNKEAGDEVAVVAGINIPTEIILEPNESYTFSPTVSGLADDSLEWSLVNATEGGGTVLQSFDSTAKLTIGENETRSMFRVLVKSKQEDANGNPMAQRYVNVYVRRVNNMDINGVLFSGVNFAKDAEYKLFANLEVANPDPWAIEGITVDAYVDPYTVKWEVIEGDATVTGSGISAKVKLNEALDAGDKVVVRATSLHAAGTANKEGKAYDSTVVAEWTLKPSSNYITKGGGWRRRSATAQATLTGAIDSLKGSFINETGVNWVFEFRYKPVHETNWVVTNNVSDSDGWHSNNGYGNDSNDSKAIFLRKDITSSWDYRYDYDVEIRVRMLNGAGKELWPTREVGDSTDLNVVAGVVQKVQITFNSTPLGLTESTGNTEANAPDVEFPTDANTVELLKKCEIIGIETTGTQVDNSYVYTLEKKVDGGWDAITDQLNIENQGREEYKLGFRNNQKNEDGSYPFEGLYRVKIGLKDMDKYDINTGSTSKEDYVLWSEGSEGESGYGIFYFNAVAKK